MARGMLVVVPRSVSPPMNAGMALVERICDVASVAAPAMPRRSAHGPRGLQQATLVDVE